MTTSQNPSTDTGTARPTPAWLERAIERGDLAPAARDMSTSDVLWQYGQSNGLTETEARRELHVTPEHTPLAQRVNTRRGETTYTGVIIHLERTTSSVNGNPAWRATFGATPIGSGGWIDGPTYRTSSDSSVSYELDNPEYRNTPVTVALTRAGRIFAIEVAQ